YLIDNALIDQYLIQYKVEVTKAEVEARINQIREELKKQNGTLEKMMQDVMLTEDELRTQITADLRWDKYALGQCTDKALRELYDKSPEMFDGTMVRARHILLTPAPGDTQAAQQMPAQLLQLKKQVEDEVAK